jgi:hypothetical protein
MGSVLKAEEIGALEDAIWRLQGRCTRGSGDQELEQNDDDCVAHGGLREAGERSR